QAGHLRGLVSGGHERDVAIAHGGRRKKDPLKIAVVEIVVVAIAAEIPAPRRHRTEDTRLAADEHGGVSRLGHQVFAEARPAADDVEARGELATDAPRIARGKQTRRGGGVATAAERIALTVQSADVIAAPGLVVEEIDRALRVGRREAVDEPTVAALEMVVPNAKRPIALGQAPPRAGLITGASLELIGAAGQADGGQKRIAGPRPGEQAGAQRPED